MAELPPDLRRNAWESMAGWCNRLRHQRAASTTDTGLRSKLESMEWYETEAGDLQLRPIRNAQSKLDLS